uniref:Uncharacterized protein n=1 Tax=Romanomermis culicivorax TaxID=13658 RepID=A0A915J0Y0_ROMCU
MKLPIILCKFLSIFPVLFLLIGAGRRNEHQQESNNKKVFRIFRNSFTKALKNARPLEEESLYKTDAEVEDQQQVFYDENDHHQQKDNQNYMTRMSARKKSTCETFNSTKDQSTNFNEQKNSYTHWYSATEGLYLKDLSNCQNPY